MNVNLQPKDLLSQVVFVHDYVQLVFQDCSFSFYNRLTYQHGCLALGHGTPGFCDALVSLIGSTVLVELGHDRFSLHFSNGATVHVATSGPDVRGPEAWIFSRLGSPTVVEQNS